jgi:hypothetical protein
LKEAEAMRSLLKHGEFVAPEVAAFGEKEQQEPNSKALNGVLQRFSKHLPATEHSSAMGAVSAVYEDAIQFAEAARSAQMRGIALMFVIFATAMAVWLGLRMPTDIANEIEDGLFGWDSWLFYGFIVLFFATFVRRWIVVAWRIDMFAADDEPTIFDRKHTRIYRLFTPLDGSANEAGSRFKPIELQAVEYDWNHVTAEHRVELVTSGQTVSRIHRLVMIARDRPKPGEKQGRLLEEFNVGNSMGLGENSVPMLWEHIRRYMEEGGPAIPQDEPLQVFERPKTLWQSFGVVGPFGPRFMYWWREHRFLTLFVFTTLPFSLPFLTVWGTCNWISHKTMRKTVWPDEVHRRIGKPIRTV